MTTSAFEYHAPTNVVDALSLLDRHGDSAKVLAGGHSLIPLMKLRLARPEVIIDLGEIAALSYIREVDGGLAIGAMTTYAELASAQLVKDRSPMLAEAAGQVADPLVRNRGTLGGNLSHADPASDLPAVAVALGAELSVQSNSAHRTIAADDFFVDLLTTALGPTEVLTEIVIPAAAVGMGSAYAKFANKASRYAIVGVAATVTVSGGVCQDARIGVTGAGPKAVRATEAEATLRGKALDNATVEAAAERAGAGIDFSEDIHASAEYRAHLTSVYARRAIAAAASRAG